MFSVPQSLSVKRILQESQEPETRQRESLEQGSPTLSEGGEG